MSLGKAPCPWLCGHFRPGMAPLRLSELSLRVPRAARRDFGLRFPLGCPAPSARGGAFGSSWARLRPPGCADFFEKEWHGQLQLSELSLVVPRAENTLRAGGGGSGIRG